METLGPNTSPAIVQALGHAIALDRAKPKTADVLDAFRPEVAEDGTFTVDLKTERERQTFAEMKRPWRRECAQVMEERATPTVKIRAANGGLMDLPAHLEGNVARDGRVKPVISYGRRRTRYWRDKGGAMWVQRPGADWERE